MSGKEVVHYPKGAAKAETTSRRQHGDISNYDGTMLPKEKTLALTRSFFELSGAHPYIFDTLAYVCTKYRQNIDRIDDEKETHFRVRIPFEHFLDFALDGRNQYKPRLMAEIYDLAMVQKGKVLPLDRDHSVLTVPLRVELFYEDGNKVDRDTIRHFQNLNGEWPVKGITIEFYKPLFASLFIGVHGESWFPLPKAFHAKMLEAMDKYRNRPEFKNAGITAFPIQYRKLYLYMNLHDNGIGEHLHLNAEDAMLSCYPTLVKTVKTATGDQHYIDWWPSRLFVRKGCNLFNRMADDGLMDGVKLVPTGIWYDKPLQELRVKVQRAKKYKEVPEFTDDSPFAALPDLRPNEDNNNTTSDEKPPF